MQIIHKIIISLVLLLSTNIYLFSQDIDSLSTQLEGVRLRLDGPGSKAVTQENKPLVVINIGEIEFKVDADDTLTMKNLDPHWIEAIKISKGQEALDKYGPEAKDGAVIITLKADSIDVMPVTIRERLKPDN